MSDPTPLNRQHLQEAPLLANPGLLDQLGLPPKAVRYLRANQRRAWIVTGCIVALIAAVSLFNSYSSYRAGKAASALTEAMKADAGKRPELLAKVVEDYSSSAAGLWAKIELAQLTLAKGDVDKAIGELEEVRKSVDKTGPLAPLLLNKLAGLYENKNDVEKALALFDELSRFKGFEALAYEAMGRLYEKQKKNDKALETYQKYLALGAEEGGATAPQAALQQAGTDPDREMIQARINDLQGK